ncbi:MAG: PDDEXK nuclease domain-containing protein [Leptolyngbyaceae bacterium]|nr:PDDEXK nuclease domain-containing protein [Leptolyngbyaceae bacterium]
MAKKASISPTAKNYVAFLGDLKTRIRQAQVKAALAVNRELVLLYWHIGKEILQRQEQEGWGAKVITQLSKDLKREFPEMKGFSRTNLMYMRAFAAAYPEAQIVQEVLGQIPWYHNITLLDKLNEKEHRLWYARATLTHGWSRNVLVMQIENGLHTRQGSAITNFESTLPQPQSDLAQQLIKDPYNFDFLTLRPDVKEQELERALVDHIRDFLLELGIGFAFMGSQYPIEVDGRDYRLDLLFYHVQLRCYIVIDLKMGEFEPEYSGKMNFYVSAVDEILRHPADNPTIGIILCKSKRKTTVEYALRGLDAPIAVSTHALPAPLQDQLPTAEELEEQLDAAVTELEEGTDKSQT